MEDRQQFHVELVNPTEDLAVVELEGELDVYTAPQFKEALFRGIAGGASASSSTSPR